MFKSEYNQYKGNVGVFIFEHQGTVWGLELCHLKELPKMGKYKEGDIIAYSGNTGGSTTGAHLHTVLHHNAHVTKHYELLKSREAFLQLEKEGAIVDCFEWFNTKLQETPKPQPQQNVVSMPEKQENPQNIKIEAETVKLEAKPLPAPEAPFSNKGIPNFLIFILNLIKSWKR